MTPRGELALRTGNPIVDHIISPELGEKKKFLGAIIFAGGKKVVAISTETTGVTLESGKRDIQEKLACTYPDISPDTDLTVAPNASGRVLNLSHLDEVVVNQIGLEKVSFTTARSLRARPSVVVEIPFADAEQPELGDTQKFSMPEEEMLRFLTGQNGGIAIFEGMGRPQEDNAFIFEQQVGDQKHGFVFFFHPKETPLLGLHSIEGVEVFLESLNASFTQNPVPFQDEAVRIVDNEITKGKLGMEHPRDELFKAIAIANVRLADRDSGDSTYSQFLKSAIPTFRKNWLEKLFVNTDSAIANAKNARQQAVDKIINNGGKTEQWSQVGTAKGAHENSPDVDTITRLISLEAIRMRSDVVGKFGLVDNKMANYMNQVALFAEKVFTGKEFADAFTLLNEMSVMQGGCFYSDPYNRKYFYYRGWGQGVSERFAFNSHLFLFHKPDGVTDNHWGIKSIKTIIERVKVRQIEVARGTVVSLVNDKDEAGSTQE